MTGPSLAGSGAADVNRVEGGPRSRSRFWEDVRAEARATWGGRFRRLWIAVAIVIGVTSLILPRVEVSGMVPQITIGIGLHLWTIGVWGSAWLGADLLSLRFAANPDPLREWTPREFLARALGRLGPFYAMLLIAGGVYAGHSIGYTLVTGRPIDAGNAIDDLKSWSDAPAIWVSWSLLPATAGLPYASLAALLSATARRPRRLLIAFVAVVFGTLLACGGVYLLDRWLIHSSVMPWLLDGELLRLYGIAPGLALGMFTYVPIEKMIWGETSAPFVRYSLVNSAVLALYALLPALATWVIAARRCRRHPRTAPPQF